MSIDTLKRKNILKKFRSGILSILQQVIFINNRESRVHTYMVRNTSKNNIVITFDATQSVNMYFNYNPLFKLVIFC